MPPSANGSQMPLNTTHKPKLGCKNVGASISTDECEEFIRLSRRKGVPVHLSQCVIREDFEERSGAGHENPDSFRIDGHGIDGVTLVDCQISSTLPVYVTGESVSIAGGEIGGECTFGYGAKVSGTRLSQYLYYTGRGFRAEGGSVLQDCIVIGRTRIWVADATLENPVWETGPWGSPTLSGGYVAVTNAEGRVLLNSGGWVVLSEDGSRPSGLEADLDRTFLARIDSTNLGERITTERRLAAALDGDNYIGSRNLGAWRTYLEFCSDPLSRPGVLDEDAVAVALAASPN
jgi:hypothetical protein